MCDIAHFVASLSVVVRREADLSQQHCPSMGIQAQLTQTGKKPRPPKSKQPVISMQNSMGKLKAF